MIGLRDNPGGRQPPPLSGTALGLRRERAADEARWARQLGKTAAAPAPPPERRPAAFPRLAPARTLLEVVDGVTRYDSLLIPRILPVATGEESEDLVCGSCGAVIARQAGRAALRRCHPHGDRLVVRCTCRALNVICGEAGRSNRQILRQRKAAPEQRSGRAAAVSSA